MASPLVSLTSTFGNFSLMQLHLTLKQLQITLLQLYLALKQFQVTSLQLMLTSFQLHLTVQQLQIILQQLQIPSLQLYLALKQFQVTSLQLMLTSLRLYLALLQSHYCLTLTINILTMNCHSLKESPINQKNLLHLFCSIFKYNFKNTCYEITPQLYQKYLRHYSCTCCK